MESSVYFLLCIELFVICFFDIKERKIRNAWSLFHLVLCPVLFLSFPDSYFFTWSFFYIPLAVLLIGFVLFALNIAGAGDIKFLSTFCLLIPLAKQETFIYYLLVTTVFVALCIFIYNLIKSWKTFLLAIRSLSFIIIKESIGSRFPYSIVILISWLVFGWKEKIIYF